MRRAIATATLALAFAIPGPVPAQEQSLPALPDMTEAERDAFRAEVRAYLMEHPEVLMEAIQVLEARRAADAAKVDSEMIAAHGAQIFHDPNSWVGGNPDGDVTLVEFSDYRCGYCKQAHPELQELLRRDPNIRLVVKEFPILGPESVLAARMATAALDLDRSKYGALNDALMSFDGQLTEAVAYRIASDAGYDIAALKARAASSEIEARIGDTYALARALGLQGTPSFVLGDRIIRGYLPIDQMLAAVTVARAAMN
ncbi:MAG: DsbA family protein [Paracoccaceae bacterium]